MVRQPLTKQGKQFFKQHRRRQYRGASVIAQSMALGVAHKLTRPATKIWLAFEHRGRHTTSGQPQRYG
jgi:hypothetical protein